MTNVGFDFVTMLLIITENSSSLTPPTDEPVSNQSAPTGTSRNCSEGFFFDENASGICRPICGEFSFNTVPQASLIFYKIGIIASAITTVVVIILSVTVQRLKL
jgi:hypothetical protein